MIVADLTPFNIDLRCHTHEKQQQQQQQQQNHYLMLKISFTLVWLYIFHNENWLVGVIQFFQNYSWVVTCYQYATIWTHGRLY